MTDPSLQVGLQFSVSVFVEGFQLEASEYSEDMNVNLLIARHH